MYDTTTKLLQPASKNFFKRLQTNSKKSFRNYLTLLYTILHISVCTAVSLYMYYHMIMITIHPLFCCYGIYKSFIGLFIHKCCNRVTVLVCTFFINFSLHLVVMVYQGWGYLLCTRSLLCQPCLLAVSLLHFCYTEEKLLLS